MKKCFILIFALILSTMPMYANDDGDDYEPNYRSWTLQDLSDSQFCFRFQYPLQVCNFALNFYNMLEAGEMLEKTKDAAAQAKIKAKGKQYVRQMCFNWEQIPPRYKDFIINEVGDGYQPLIDKGEMEELCLTGKIK